MPEVLEPPTTEEKLDELIRLIDKGRELDAGKELELKSGTELKIQAGFILGSSSLRNIHKRAHELCPKS
jgi:hypothetical protein